MSSRQRSASGYGIGPQARKYENVARREYLRLLTLYFSKEHFAHLRRTPLPRPGNSDSHGRRVLSIAMRSRTITSKLHRAIPPLSPPPSRVCLPFDRSPPAEDPPTGENRALHLALCCTLAKRTYETHEDHASLARVQRERLSNLVSSRRHKRMSVIDVSVCVCVCGCQREYSLWTSHTYIHTRAYTYTHTRHTTANTCMLAIVVSC